MTYATYVIAAGVLGAIILQVRDWVFGVKAGMTSKDLEKIAGVLSKQSSVVAADEEKADASYKAYEDLKKGTNGTGSPGNSGTGSGNGTGGLPPSA